MNLRKAVIILIGTAVCTSCMAATEQQKRSVYYAEHMGSYYGLDDSQKQQVYNHHMEKLKTWNAVSAYKGLPSFNSRKAKWSQDFRTSILGIIGLEKEAEWKQYNQSLQNEMNSASLDAFATDTLLEKYESTAPTPQNVGKKSKRAVYYAEQMAAHYNLDIEQRRQIYELHLKKTIEWDLIAPLRGTPEFRQKIRPWSTKFRESILAIIGPEKEQEWKEFNRSIQNTMKDRIVNSTVTDELVAVYTAKPAPAGKDSIDLQPIPRDPSVTESMHQRALYVANEATAEFSLNPVQRKKVYDLQLLVIRCWNELANLRRQGRHAEVAEYSTQIQKSYKQGILQVVGNHQEQQYNAFSRRIASNLQQQY